MVRLQGRPHLPSFPSHRLKQQQYAFTAKARVYYKVDSDPCSVGLPCWPHSAIKRH